MPAPKPGKDTPAADAEQGAEATEAENGKKGGQKTSFAALWPKEAKLTTLVEANPKRPGSKSFDRFEHYFTSKTVGEFLEKGGTYADIAFDMPRGRVQVG